MRLPWLVALVAAACNSNAAAPPTGGPTPAPAPTPTVKDAGTATVVDAHSSTLAGAEIYATLCSPCHGKDLKGYAADHAPSLITETFLASATDDFLKKSITTGRPGTSMAAYSKVLGGPLDDAAIDRLVAFIRTGRTPTKELPAFAKGDATKGKAVYDQNCASCHGDQQKRGEAIHLANYSFLQQASDPFIAYAVTNGRPGTKMAPYGSLLSDEQIRDVVSYVRSYQTGATEVGQLPAPTGKEPLIINPKGKDPTWKVREDRFVAVDDAVKAYKAGQKMIIIDARPPSEWMRAHIKGAVSIPYHDVARLAEIPKDTWVLAYCACPHHLSGIVVDELRKRGHLKSAVLDEGINDWHRKGYPMVTAPGVQTPTAEPAHSHAGHGH
jgi:mono/diheme cytochrome c family protein/rhodanese-related sulfurtransferase